MSFRLSSILLFTAIVNVCFSQGQPDSWPRDPASASPRPGQYNFTYEVPFDITDLNSLTPGYSFNLSLGTPPQTFPIFIDLISSDVAINNVTLNITSDGSGTEIKNYGYNPNLSSTSQRNLLTINLQSIIEPPTTRTGATYANGLSIYYTGDNYTIGSVNVVVPLSFITYRESIYPLPIGKRPALSLYHSIGFGLPESSYISYDRARRNDAAGRYGGVMDDLRFGAGVIRSRTYSIWLDKEEEKSGHLLFGGTDENAYVGSINTLKTTRSTVKNYVQEYPLLTVNTSIKSFTPSGGSSKEFNLSLGKTAFSTAHYSTFPPALAKSIFDFIGADYTTLPRNQPKQDKPGDLDILFMADAMAPCSYTTNSSTFDLHFEGSNLNISVPISDMIFGQRTAQEINGIDYCRLAIVATPNNGNDVSYLSAQLSKKLYRVYDLDNDVISVALTDFASTTRDIKPIPQAGGVAAMQLSTPASTPTSTAATATPKSGAARLDGLVGQSSTFGLLAIVSFLVGFFL